MKSLLYHILSIWVFIIAAYNQPLLGLEFDQETPMEIEILPYLQNPSPTSMSVNFVSQKATKVDVEFSMNKAQTKPSLISAEKIEIPLTDRIRWQAKLNGLKSGTSYTYKIIYTEGEKGAPKSSASYTFTTPSISAKQAKAIAFNDIHYRFETMEKLMTYIKPDDYEISLLMGDMWENPSLGKYKGERIFKVLSEYVRILNASEKPMLYIHGNHETMGYYKHIGSLFDLPFNQENPTDEFKNQKFYFDVRYGPIWFIAVDSAPDGNKPSDHYVEYRGKQAAWLKNIFDKSQYKKAPWILLTSHIPLYTPWGWDQLDSTRQWSQYINDKVDIMLAGHDHRPHFVPKGKTYIHERTKEEIVPPFPVLIGGDSQKNATIMRIVGDQSTLSVQMINIEGKQLEKIVLKK